MFRKFLLQQNIPTNTLLSRIKLIENLHKRNFIQKNINRSFIGINKSIDLLNKKENVFQYLRKQR